MIRLDPRLLFPPDRQTRQTLHRPSVHRFGEEASPAIGRKGFLTSYYRNSIRICLGFWGHFRAVTKNPIQFPREDKRELGSQTIIILTIPRELLIAL